MASRELNSEIAPAGRSPTPFRQRFRGQAAVLAWCVAVMWGLLCIDYVLPGAPLLRLGIQPRSVSGLVHIPLAPWLHGNLGHLAANTVPFLVLGWLVMLRHTRDFWIVTFISALTGGLGAWLLGSSGTVHIGVSGVVFGYFGFLVLRAGFERSVASFLVAALVGMLYGGLIWGIFPSQPDISWQCHLFGFLGGAATAKLLTNREAVGSGQ